MAGDVSWEILAQLRHELGVAFVLLAQQIELLLFIAAREMENTKYKNKLFNKQPIMSSDFSILRKTVLLMYQRDSFSL